MMPTTLLRAGWARSRSVCASLLIVAALGLVTWAAFVMWTHPYDGLDWSARTGWVAGSAPGSPAERAGVAAGDRIVRVNGTLLAQADAILIEERIGRPVALTVSRDGAEREVQLVPAEAPASVRIARLQPLLVGLVFWLVSLGAWILRPQHRAAVSFLWLGQAAAAMLGAGALSSVSHPAGILLFGLLLPLTAILTLQLAVVFPQPLAARRRRWLLGLAWGLTGSLALIYALSTVAGGHTRGPEVIQQARDVMVVLTFGVALALFVGARRGAALEAQRRRRVLIAGVIASLLPILLGSFVPSLLGMAGRVSYVWTFPFLVLLPVSFAYAVVSGELGPFDRFLNRSLVYGLLTAALAGLSFASLLGLERFLPLIRVARIAANALLVMVGAVLLNTLRAALQRWVDRLFYGGWYDYRAVVRAASGELSRALDLPRLAEGLLAAARSMRFGAAALLWPDGEGLAPRGAYGYSEEDLARLRLPARGAWSEKLADAAGPCQPGTAGLPALECVDCWLPLVSRGELRAVVALGRRQGEDRLDSQDRDLLATLAGQAAVAAENIGLLEALRAQVDELRRTQSEVAEVRRRLAEGREMEQQRLARELHDGPVQDLEALRLQLSVEAPQIGGGDWQRRILGVIDALRAVCRDMRPPALARFGLSAAIRSDVERLAAELPGLVLELNLTTGDRALSQEVRLALYRIYREALRNVQRHAQARRVQVQLRLDDGKVTLEVSDDGRGFQTPQRWVVLARQGHLGLLGAEEWAQSIGGQLEVRSALGEGTTVRVTAPISGEEERLRSS